VIRVRRVPSFLAVGIVLVYPFVIWLAPEQLEPRYLALLLLLVALVHLSRIKGDASWIGWMGGTLLLLALALWANALLPLKLYPVAVNAGLLGLFAYSLLVPPTMIERIARAREPDLPVAAVAYTRRVTQVWCVFFAVNGIVALFTALWMPAVVWTLYNGVIAYVLMGLLFAGEYCVRWRFKRRHHV
jgi:uncharacterized membrane protein